MSGRILIAGVVAGLVAFGWGFVSHAMLGLADSVLKPMPNESAVLGTLAENVKTQGMYMFPDAGMSAGMKGSKDQQKAAMETWQKAYVVQPHGLLVISPANGPLKMGPLMGFQLAIEIVCGLIAAALLAAAAASLPAYFTRVAFVSALGLFAAVGIDGSYWNWYGFTAEYLRASVLDAVIGWTLAGLALAAIIKPKRA
jgi:hypothetical protein